MRIYIAGPMSSIEFLNFPVFHAAAAMLRALDHEVVNPAELNPDPGTSWADCMRVDIAQLVTCDAVVLLPGYERSRGAMIERDLALKLEMRVVPLILVMTEAAEVTA